MRFSAFILVATASGALAEPIGPLPLSAVLAAYHDTVRLPPEPSVWHQISHTVTDAEQVTESVPAGQTAAAWTQIITVKTLPPTRDPKPVVDGTVAIMRAICAHVTLVHAAHAQQLGESSALDTPLPIYDESETLITCRDPDLAKLRARVGANSIALRRYEVTWYKIMKSGKANYIVQRSWHGDAMDSSSPLGSDAVLANWKNWITRITLVRSRN
jgi:hypothetical protein